MRLGKCAVVGLGICALGISVALAAPSTRPSSPDARDEGSQTTTIRLVAPWSRLSSLSDDQRHKIADIHRKALADIKAIQLKQEEDIKALLSEDQKKELRDLMDKEAADRKSRAANRSSSTGKPDETATEEKSGTSGGGSGDK
jgi:Spy/CpxP family protein refolding chaperone